MLSTWREIHQVSNKMPTTKHIPQVPLYHPTAFVQKRIHIDRTFGVLLIVMNFLPLSPSPSSMLVLFVFPFRSPSLPRAKCPGLFLLWGVLSIERKTEVG